MATLEEMKSLGYGAQKSSTDQILELLTGQNEFVNKQAETKKKDFEDQQKLYTTLRENGYSQQEAHDRVTRNFRSTNLLQNILEGKLSQDNKAPTGYDKFAVDTLNATANASKIKSPEETAADIAKTKSEATLNTSKASAYDRGDMGKRQVAADKMNAAQLQREIKRMSDPFENPDYDSEETKSYTAYLNQRLQQISQYPGSQPTEPAATPSKVPGARVPMIRPDGVPVQVASKDLQKALAKGYKRRPFGH